MVATPALDLMGGLGTVLWRLRATTGVRGVTTFLEEGARNKEGGTGVEQVLGRGEDRREGLDRGWEEGTGTLEDRGEDREDMVDREDLVGGEIKDKIRAKEEQEETRAKLIIRTITEDRDKDRHQASVQEMNYRHVLMCVQGSVPGCLEPV